MKSGAYLHNTTIVNAGTIQALGTRSTGLILQFGGTVSNKANGLIDGVYFADQFAGTLSNFGTITNRKSANYNIGIFLQDGGKVYNSQRGFIEGVYAVGATATVLNHGTIQAIEKFQSGITLRNGGTVTNYFGGLIEGYVRGIVSYLGILNNFGTIKATSVDPQLNFRGGAVRAGFINNAVGAFIEGYSGVNGYTIHNRGIIKSIGINASAISLEGKTGSLDNYAGGIIEGSVTIGSSGFVNSLTVRNEGTIIGNGFSSNSLPKYGSGIYLEDNGFIVNAKDGIIEGSSGISARYGAVTVMNSGIIGAPRNSGEFGINLLGGGNYERFNRTSPGRYLSWRRPCFQYDYKFWHHFGQ